MAKPSAAVLKAIGEAAIPVTKRIKLGPHRIGAPLNHREKESILTSSLCKQGSVELHESRTKSDYDAILEAIGPNTKAVMMS